MWLNKSSYSSISVNTCWSERCSECFSWYSSCDKSSISAWYSLAIASSIITCESDPGNAFVLSLSYIKCLPVFHLGRLNTGIRSISLDYVCYFMDIGHTSWHEVRLRGERAHQGPPLEPPLLRAWGIRGLIHKHRHKICPKIDPKDRL